MIDNIHTQGVLLINALGPVITTSSHESSPLRWSEGVFPALKILSDERVYRLFVLCEASHKEKIEALLPTLGDQGITIEKLVTDISEIENLDYEHSHFIGLEDTTQLNFVHFTSWGDIISLFSSAQLLSKRSATIQRSTKETSISITCTLDGSGKGVISTGLPFFDHMLDQIARHGHLDVDINCQGDLDIDEHHTVEDVAITLGEAVKQALGDKKGIARYGFALVPMDEALAQVAIDFSNRPWFVWEVEFTREMVGNFPTELLTHFFKSFSDEARCTLHMKVGKANTHHQAEALCKAFAKALRHAVMRYPKADALPSTKGLL